MTLLLMFLFGMVAVGMFTEHLDLRTYALVVGAAVLVTGLYYFFTRFMT